MTLTHWLYLLIALQVADAVSTYIALKDADATEGNGFLAAVMRKLGVVPGLIAVKAPFVAAVWYFQAYMPIEFIWLLCAGLSFVTAKNINVIRKANL